VPLKLDGLVSTAAPEHACEYAFELECSDSIALTTPSATTDVASIEAQASSPPAPAAASTTTVLHRTEWASLRSLKSTLAQQLFCFTYAALLTCSLTHSRALSLSHVLILLQ